VSLALIDGGRLAWARAYGDGASAGTLYQAASISKLVTAVVALRLVQDGRLAPDADVNEGLSSWKVPESELTRGHPVTLRGLLSMTGGTGMHALPGYEPGTPVPDLGQSLDGRPPATSPPVRVGYVPGSRYLYSNGGYEIVQALVQDATGRPFADVARELVLEPAGMADSGFDQPLPERLVPRAAKGHWASGRELPGGWRVFPELTAAGLWSTPTDLARLLVEIGRAYRGEGSALLPQETAKAMLRRRNGGHYGLGGAVAGSGRDLVLMKKGHTTGCQDHLLLFPAVGQGLVVITDSENGAALAEAPVRRAAVVYRWPALGRLGG
jgi:CubicO group peptidase (beta-lactamase class C family)